MWRRLPYWVGKAREQIHIVFAKPSGEGGQQIPPEQGPVFVNAILRTRSDQYHVTDKELCFEFVDRNDMRSISEVSVVELRPITEENFIDAFALRLAPGQERFVSHPVRSLAQAYVYRDQCQPFGIYAEGKMIGYVMVIYDRDIPEYDIWHMMIDASTQGRGYGGEALDRVMEYIRTQPFGESHRVALTCNKDNFIARKLYESREFSATGAEDEDEIELAVMLG